jgi:hypothetical protein
MFTLDRDVQMEGRSVVFQITASAPLVVEIERGEVRSLVRGLTQDEAVDSLSESLTLAAPPEVVILPDWIKRWEWLDRVSLLPFRIQVVVLE